MALTTVQTIAQRANILTQVVDENVGTGDNSELYFDLDKDNVITGTVVLSYAASGSNNFTALTETTHYAISDYPAGRITFTTAGRTALGTNILYATYYYLERLSEATITEFITAAEERLQAYTGRVWVSTDFTEYFDGKSRSFYPRTDRPFQRDRPEWDSFQVDHWPLNSVSSVYLLDRQNNSWDSCQTSDGGVFTDNTEESNTPSGTAFYVYAATPAANDAIYFGLSNKFLGLYNRLQTLGTDGGSLAVTWEYYNGSSWASLSGVTAGTTGSNLFTASGKVSWTLPDAWAKNSVNSSSELYFVRARMSAGAYGTSPKLWEAYPDKDSILYEEISLRSIDYTRDGRITFLDNLIPDGVRNLRITYNAGMASGDEGYNLGIDLAKCIGALMCAVAITGGSFDDETHFQIGDWNATIGEVYVNVAEVVKQLRSEIDELKKAIGGRVEVV